MKFSTSKTELHQALQKLSKATPTRSTLPILGCTLIDAKEEKTTLRATDLEITIQAGNTHKPGTSRHSSAPAKDIAGHYQRNAGDKTDPIGR